MKENNIVTFLGLMEDDLWNNTDVTEPSFDIALSVINDIRRRLLEGTLVEKKVEPIKAKVGEGVSLTKNQRIANSMKTMTWKTIK